MTHSTHARRRQPRRDPNQPHLRTCLCGCGVELRSPRQHYATAACRKRIQRLRDRLETAAPTCGCPCQDDPELHDPAAGHPTPAAYNPAARFTGTYTRNPICRTWTAAHPDSRPGEPPISLKPKTK